MALPTIQDYQEALQHPRSAFMDPELAQGTIAVSGLGTPRVFGGGFALTYAVQSGSKKYAVRCFHREVKNRERRYEAISKKLKSLASPYFLDFQYQPAGVKVNGITHPIVKMDWATGETLAEFVAKSRNDATKLNNLIDSLGRLAAYLESIGIAHGDIQDLNVIVFNEGKKLQLIDYDGLYLPELASLGSSENGLADYQHPKRDGRCYDATLDRFSFIALNLALRALRDKPSVWQSSQSGAGIIVFKANDFANPHASATFSELSKIPNLRQDVLDFATICTGSISDVPTLSQFLSGTYAPASTIHVGTRPVQARSRYISAYPVLDATDYSAFEQHIGGMVELVGRVFDVKANRTRGGKPYIFVNFAHWRGKAVKINIWSEALEKGGDTPSKAWVGRWVSIRGLVEPVYTSRQYNYSHISITADSIGQISEITEAEAKYRLDNAIVASQQNFTAASAPETIIVPDNLAALQKLRDSVPSVKPPPRASTAPPAPAPAPRPAPPPTGTNTASNAHSRNQAILRSMQAPKAPPSPAPQPSRYVPPPPQSSPMSQPSVAQPRGNVSQHTWQTSNPSSTGTSQPGGFSSPRAPAPAPSPYKQYAEVKKEPRGFWGWLTGLFK